MSKLARLSAAERAQIIDDFIAEAFDGLPADPKLLDSLRLTVPELPEELTPEQVTAWVELAELVQDPGFRRQMRTVAEFHAGKLPASGPARDSVGPGPDAFEERLTALGGPPRELFSAMLQDEALTERLTALREYVTDLRREALRARRS